MNSSAGLLRSLSWLRSVALVPIAISAAGCSAESARFGEAPYAARRPGRRHGLDRSGQGAPVGHVESRPLPQSAPVRRQRVPRAPPAAAGGWPPTAPRPHRTILLPRSPHLSSGVGTGGLQSSVKSCRRIGRQRIVRHPALKSPERSRRRHQSCASRPRPGRWSWDGGTAVTVAPGETIEGIARRHGVPATVIMEANNLTSPNAIQAGQRLVIPRYSTTASASAAAPATVPPSTHAPASAARRRPRRPSPLPP